MLFKLPGCVSKHFISMWLDELCLLRLDTACYNKVQRKLFLQMLSSISIPRNNETFWINSRFQFSVSFTDWLMRRKCFVIHLVISCSCEYLDCYFKSSFSSKLRSITFSSNAAFNHETSCHLNKYLLKKSLVELRFVYPEGTRNEYKIDDLILQLICHNCPNLKILHIRGAEDVTSRGLGLIAKYCFFWRI